MQETYVDPSNFSCSAILLRNTNSCPNEDASNCKAGPSVLQDNRSPGQGEALMLRDRGKLSKPGAGLRYRMHYRQNGGLPRRSSIPEIQPRIELYLSPYRISQAATLCHSALGPIREARISILNISKQHTPAYRRRSWASIAAIYISDSVSLSTRASQAPGSRIENTASMVMERCLNEGDSVRRLIEIFFAIPLQVEDMLVPHNHRGQARGVMFECAPAFRRDSGCTDSWILPRLWGTILKAIRKRLNECFALIWSDPLNAANSMWLFLQSFLPF